MQIKIIKTIRENFGKALRLYPVPLLVNAIITCLVITNIHILSDDLNSSSNPDHLFWEKVVQHCFHWSLILGFVYVLSIGVSNAIRINPHWSKYKWQGYGVALTVGILLHFLIPLDVDQNNPSIGTFDFLPLDIFIYGLSAHLVTAILPFIGSKRNSNQLLWRYNQGQLTQFVVAGIYAGILYGGIALSIFSFNLLIIKDFIPVEAYAYSAAILFIIGHAFIFAINSTEDGEHWVEEQHNYTKVLRNLVRYILIPIIGLYLIILYLYMGKITALWSLPKGIVSLMTMVFSVVGYFTVLISYPFQFEEDNRWLSNVYRRFSWLLLPLMPLLFIAVYVRVSEYGFTELRVALTYLDIWLFLITIYYALVKRPNILVLPLTLLLLALSARFLPKYNFHRWSIESQEQRLIGYLNTLKMYNPKDSSIKSFDANSYFKTWNKPSTLPADSLLLKWKNSEYVYDQTAPDEVPAEPAAVTTESIEETTTQSQNQSSGTSGNENSKKSSSIQELQQKYFLDSISYEIYQCLEYLCQERKQLFITNDYGKQVKLIVESKKAADNYFTYWDEIRELMTSWNLPIISYKNRYASGDENSYVNAEYSPEVLCTWNKPLDRSLSSKFANKLVVPVHEGMSTQTFIYEQNGKTKTGFVKSPNYNSESIFFSTSENGSEQDPNSLQFYLRDAIKKSGVLSKIEPQKTGKTYRSITANEIIIPIRWQNLPISLYLTQLEITLINNEMDRIQNYSGFLIIGE